MLWGIEGSPKALLKRKVSFSSGTLAHDTKLVSLRIEHDHLLEVFETHLSEDWRTTGRRPIQFLCSDTVPAWTVEEGSTCVWVTVRILIYLMSAQLHIRNLEWSNKTQFHYDCTHSPEGIVAYFAFKNLSALHSRSRNHSGNITDVTLCWVMSSVTLGTLEWFVCCSLKPCSEGMWLLAPHHFHPCSWHSSKSLLMMVRAVLTQDTCILNISSSQSLRR